MNNQRELEARIPTIVCEAGTVTAVPIARRGRHLRFDLITDFTIGRPARAALMAVVATKVAVKEVTNFRVKGDTYRVTIVYHPDVTEQPAMDTTVDICRQLGTRLNHPAQGDQRTAATLRVAGNSQFNNASTRSALSER